VELAKPLQEIPRDFAGEEEGRDAHRSRGPGHRQHLG
jgi:hypothetical protein